MYKISIIIPCYYNIKFISRCLHSIRIQRSLSVVNPEIILINDNSPYFSDQEIQKTINHYSRYFQIKYLKNEKNQGPGYSRQQGLNNVSKDTQFIIFLDDDDAFYDENVFENFYKKLNINTLAIMNKKQTNKLLGHILNYSLIKEKNIKFYNLYKEEDTLFMQQFMLEALRAYRLNPKLNLVYIEEYTYLHNLKNKKSLTHNINNSQIFFQYAIHFCDFMLNQEQDDLSQGYFKDTIPYISIYVLNLYKDIKDTYSFYNLIKKYNAHDLKLNYNLNDLLYQSNFTYKYINLTDYIKDYEETFNEY